MYQKCSVCGSYSDDGTIRDEKLICHECLDKEEEGEQALFSFFLIAITV